MQECMLGVGWAGSAGRDWSRSILAGLNQRASAAGSAILTIEFAVDAAMQPVAFLKTAALFGLPSSDVSSVKSCESAGLLNSRDTVYRWLSNSLRTFGEWLSLVEHLVRDQGVGGSNPLSPTNLSLVVSLTYAAIVEPSFCAVFGTFGATDQTEPGSSFARAHAPIAKGRIAAATSRLTALVCP